MCQRVVGISIFFLVFVLFLFNGTGGKAEILLMQTMAKEEMCMKTVQLC